MRLGTIDEYIVDNFEGVGVRIAPWEWFKESFIYNMEQTPDLSAEGTAFLERLRNANSCDEVYDALVYYEEECPERYDDYFVERLVDARDTLVNTICRWLDIVLYDNEGEEESVDFENLYNLNSILSNSSSVKPIFENNVDKSVKYALIESECREASALELEEVKGRMWWRVGIEDYYDLEDNYSNANTPEDIIAVARGFNMYDWERTSLIPINSNNIDTIMHKLEEINEEEDWSVDEELLDEISNVITKVESLEEDTKKKRNGKWVNKGKGGEHGEFKTKKEADAQRKAMFARGFNEGFEEVYGIDSELVRNNVDKSIKYALNDYGSSWFLLTYDDLASQEFNKNYYGGHPEPDEDVCERIRGFKSENDVADSWNAELEDDDYDDEQHKICYPITNEWIDELLKTLEEVGCDGRIDDDLLKYLEEFITSQKKESYKIPQSKLNKKRSKITKGTLVNRKEDAGDVPTANARFNNSVDFGSSGATADGGNAVGGMGESLNEDISSEEMNRMLMELWGSSKEIFKEKKTDWNIYLRKNYSSYRRGRWYRGYPEEGLDEEELQDYIYANYDDLVFVCDMSDEEILEALETKVYKEHELNDDCYVLLFVEINKRMNGGEWIPSFAKEGNR